MKRFLFAIIVLFVSTAFFGGKAEAVPPPDFQTSLIVGSGLEGPSGFAFAPDGRIFILERTGKVKIYKNGQILPTPFVELPSIATGDRGLIGIAFDPDFTNNHFVYFYYTAPDKLNRLVRFDASSDTATSGPFILYETTFPSELLHVGGSIAFGPDGKLYFAVGDNGYPPNAQMLDNPHGKILRINKDGSIPADNPFVGDPFALPEIWAYGFRNPWRFQFDSLTGKLYGGDVGDFSFEEMNQIVKGGNYGWPNAEGVCTGCPYINPIYAYPHDNKSSAVTGGPVYRGTLFPSEYHGSLFFGDYARGFVKRLSLDESGNSTGVFDFDLGAGSVVDMKVAPDGSLYYITYFPGRLYRITYSVDNHIPSAFSSADATKGIEPLVVNFSSAGSSDPDGDPLTFFWDLGDGTTSTEENPQKTYTEKGTYTVTLSVSDGVNSSQAVPIVIQVGTPPVVTIGSPKQGDTYRAGDTIAYASIALDGAGFDIDDGSIQTEVVFHHDTHTHPFHGPFPGRTGSFDVPLSGEPDPDVWYEIKVTATDTNGLSTTEVVEIFPEKSYYAIASNISGVVFFLDGIPQVGDAILEGVVGYVREISTSFVQAVGGIAYQFKEWSDGGSLTHLVSTKEENAAFAATFEEVSPFTGKYFANKTLSGEPVLVRSDPVIDFVWGSGSPDPSVPANGFSVRWSTTQFFPQGTFTFTSTTDDGVRVYLDNVLIINDWANHASTTNTHTMDIEEGDHEIRMEYYEDTGGAIAKLTWDLVADNNPSPTPPESVGKWTASYFANTTLAGKPVVLRHEQDVAFDWKDASPDPSVPQDQFSARFTRTATFDDGLYEFRLTADDGVRMYIDNVLVFDKWFDQPETTYTFVEELSAGEHDLKVEYYENYVDAVVKFSYSPTDEPTGTPTPTPDPSGGFTGKYWNYEKDTAPVIPTTEPDVERADSEIDFDWSDESPDPSITTNHFVAQWIKNDVFEEGMYEFVTESDDGIRVFIDGKKMLDQWNDHARTTHTVTVPIPAGEHEVKVEYYENYGDAISVMGYEKVGELEGEYTAEYYDNMILSGDPVLTRDEPAILFQWFEDAPDPLVPANHFSARFTKTKHFAAGEHSFTLKSDDGVRMWIDDGIIVDEWNDHALTTYTPTVTLTEGEHVIKVEYYENYGNAIVILEEH